MSGSTYRDDLIQDGKESSVVPPLEEISRYDVLLVPGTPERGPKGRTVSDRNDVSTLQLYDPQDEQDGKTAISSPPHVGNNRFIVFCKMNVTDFANAGTEAAQQAVLEQVIEIVGSTCIDTRSKRSGKILRLQPQRKIYETVADAAAAAAATVAPDTSDPTCWVELTNSQAQSFVRMCLEKEQRGAAAIEAIPASDTSQSSKNVDDDGASDDLKRRRRSSLLRRSLSSGNMLDDKKKRILQRKSIILQLQKFDTSSGDEEGLEDAIEEVRLTAKNSEGGIEGGTGSSTPSELAFRSSTGSTSTTASTAAAKRLMMLSSASSQPARPHMLERSPSWTAHDGDGLVVAHTANALDVIFVPKEHGKYEFVPNHTGNNRLEVMVQLRMQKFVEYAELGDQMHVHKLCRELVGTVRENYQGRFLVEQQQSEIEMQQQQKDVVATYLSLNDEQAAAALESMFRSRLTSKARTTDTNEYAAEKNTAAPVNEKRPSVLKQETLNQIAQLPTTFRSTGVASDIHKVALESLQKRKKRQGVSSKISKMVAAANTDIPAPPLRPLDRSHSTGHVDFSKKPLPNATRYASAGLVPSATSLPSTSSPNESSQNGIFRQSEFLPANLPIPEWNVQQVQHQNFYPPQPGAGERRPTLSQFSQGMIHDLLLQLDVSQHEDASNNSVFPNQQQPNGQLQDSIALNSKFQPGTAGHQAGNNNADYNLDPFEYNNPVMFNDSGVRVTAEAAAAAFALGLHQQEDTQDTTKKNDGNNYRT